MEEQNIQIAETISKKEIIEAKKQFQLKDNFFFGASATVFKDPFYIILGVSAVLNLLLLYYLIFLKVTTLSVFFQTNTALYNWLAIILTLFIAVLFGLSVSFLAWRLRQKKSQKPAGAGNGLLGSFLGAVSMGCPTCGAFLLPLFGVAGGLFAFPFQGLEIKLAALGLLAFSVLSSAKSISDEEKGICEAGVREGLIKIVDGKLTIFLNEKTAKPLLPVVLGLALLFLMIFGAPFVSEKTGINFKFQKGQSAAAGVTGVGPLSAGPADEVMKEINPPDGYVLNVVYGNIGPKLLESGVINLEAMKQLYKQTGQPLTNEQLKTLTEGSNEKIKITPQNSYFLLNFFWAFGLANKNPILDEGPMMQYGEGKVGSFASTGGWTLGTKNATQLYSKYEIAKLTPDQQKILEDFAFNSYRPCCSNPTGFPDCNHGMAALGLAELMVSQGATADEIFEAFKYFNSFWFPQTYFDVAVYFKTKEGKSWSQVDARTVAGKDYSTPQGWGRVRSWLKSNNLLEEPPSGGGGCGV